MYDPVAHADRDYMNTYGEELDQERRLSRVLIDPSQLVDDTYDPFETETIHGIESTPVMINAQNEIQEATDKKNKIVLVISALILIGIVSLANVSKGERTDENVTSDIARVTR